MGCLGICIIIAGWLGSGYASWEIISPHSFWSGLLFLLLWGAFGTLAQFIIMMIVNALD